MIGSDEEAQRRLTRFKEACKQAGLKMTYQRLVIFQAVLESDKHPDVETVYEAVRKRVPTISMDTVYRTLWMLKDLGVVSTLGPPRERARFDANTSRHHHFICNRCGLAKDFYSSELDELPVPEEIKAFGDVDTTHVELRGLCADCVEDERARHAESDKEEDHD